jgi:hypothetical protein
MEDIQNQLAKIDTIKETIAEYVQLMTLTTSDDVKQARNKGKELQKPIMEWMKAQNVDIVDMGEAYVKLIHRKRKAILKNEGINSKVVEILCKYMDRDNAVKVTAEISASIQESRQTVTKDAIQVKRK